MKNVSIFDNEFDNKRIMVKQDKYNYIMLTGYKNSDDEAFEKSANHSYYSNFDSLLLGASRYFDKYNITYLDFEHMIEARNKTLEHVEQIALQLENNLRVGTTWNSTSTAELTDQAIELPVMVNLSHIPQIPSFDEIVKNIQPPTLDDYKLNFC